MHAQHFTFNAVFSSRVASALSEAQDLSQQDPPRSRGASLGQRSVDDAGRLSHQSNLGQRSMDDAGLLSRPASSSFLSSGGAAAAGSAGRSCSHPAVAMTAEPIAPAVTMTAAVPVAPAAPEIPPSPPHDGRASTSTSSRRSRGPPDRRSTTATLLQSALSAAAAGGAPPARLVRASMGPSAGPVDRLSPVILGPNNRLHRPSAMLARKLSALNPKHASDRAAAELDSTESNVVAVHAFWDEEARMLAMQVCMGTGIQHTHACMRHGPRK